jgi:CRP-like cAMP-binding protein
MTTRDRTIMAPVVQKLMQRSRLGVIEIDALLDLPFQPASFHRGEYVLRDGDRIDPFIAIASGYAHRSRITGDGGRQITSIHIHGDVISAYDNLLPVFDHSVQALTKLEAVYIPREAMADAVARHPGIGTAFARDAQAEASIAREWLVTVGRRNASQRIAHFFCELAARQEAAGLSASDIHLPMTQETIADATGLTAVHVNRTIQKMRGDGLIRSQGQTMTILDRRQLQAQGDFRVGYLHGPQGSSA